jgi:hypothetical protein
MLKSQFLLEVSGAETSASIPIQASARNLEEPTSAKICAHCLLTVINTSQRIVSFKVLTNAQNRYSIRPALGILQPSQSLDITVGVSRKHAGDPAGVILLRYVKLPDDWSMQNDLVSFWSNAPKEKTKRALKLVQSVFEPDSANYSLHSSFSGTSSAHGRGSPVYDLESDFNGTPAVTSAIRMPSNQLRAAEMDRDTSAAACAVGEHPSASVVLDEPTRAIGAANHSVEKAVSHLQTLNLSTQIARVTEVSRVPQGNSASFSTLASFIPVGTSSQDNALVNSTEDSGCIAGPRSDSRTSTLSDHSHRTDDARLAIDHDIVLDFEKMRAAVSSVKGKPRSEVHSNVNRPRAKDTNSSQTAFGSADEPSSRSAPALNGETPAVNKRSRYPPVEACVSSISRSAQSIMSRLFPAASLSDQPVYVRMDPNTLQLFEGESEALLLFKIRWKDVVALSVRSCSATATVLLLVNGNSGNESSCARDIKACDSLVSDVHHTLHLMSIKGSAETVCRMVVHASRCNSSPPQSLPHVRQDSISLPS